MLTNYLNTSIILPNLYSFLKLDYLTISVGIVTAVCLAYSYHTIQQGNVGIYFVKGRLDDTYSNPGVHWAIPFLTEIEEITVRPQTDTLSTLKAVTRDGIQNSFEQIQVLSLVEQESLIPLVKKFGLGFREVLIFDRIAEELRIFCANHTIDEVSARPSGHISELGNI